MGASTSNWNTQVTSPAEFDRLLGAKSRRAALFRAEGAIATNFRSSILSKQKQKRPSPANNCYLMYAGSKHDELGLPHRAPSQQQLPRLATLEPLAPSKAARLPRQALKNQYSAEPLLRRNIPSSLRTSTEAKGQLVSKMMRQLRAQAKSVQAKPQGKPRRPNGLRPPFDLSRLETRAETFTALPPQPPIYPAAFHSQ